MSQIKYVSVVAIEGHGGQIRCGKVDKDGEELQLPTPENDVEDFNRREWERVDYFELPEPMPKSEFKDWWNDHVHDDDRPSVIDDVLETVEEADEKAEEATEAAVDDS